MPETLKGQIWRTRRSRPMASNKPWVPKLMILIQERETDDALDSE